MDESWSRAIDGYCERLDPSFWAEPLNALTNAAFVAAAAIGAASARRHDPGVLLLAGLTMAIGIGSFLFHTVATAWAALADVVPIGLFILACLVLILHRLIDLSRPWALALGLAFAPASAILTSLSRPLAEPTIGSSAGYLPPLLALLASAALLLARGHPAARPMLATAGLLALSLTLRTLDQPLCGELPLGTHWLWHLLNAVVLGRLMVTLARSGRERG